MINLSEGVVEIDVGITEETFSIDHSDWEQMYRDDVESGTAIIISSKKAIKEGVMMKANEDSIFTPEFRIPIETDDKPIEYACSCGFMFGRFNADRTCEKCNTKVEIKYGIDLSKRGWIDIGPYKIIPPATYTKIQAYIGRKRFNEILNHEIGITVTGIEQPMVRSTLASNPFKGIGIIEFEKRYVEIIEYFKRSTTKPELYRILMDRKGIAFSSKIYVMSPALRPGFLSARSKKFNHHTINSDLVSILTDYELVKRGNRVGRQVIGIIQNIQEYLMHIYTECIAKIVKKPGIIRSHIMSGRMWYSARSVIIAETEYDDIDVTRLSYKTFLSLFEIEIMNAMLRGLGNPKFCGMTTAQCRNYTKLAKYKDEVDPDIYDIINTLVHRRLDDGLFIVVNRNPSFDIGSVQCMKIIEVIPDATNDILTIPKNSLIEFTADFDGDALNVYSIKEYRVMEAFKEGFLPSKLILDRSGGYFNNNMIPVKDEISYIKCMLEEFNPVNPDDVELRNLEDILSEVGDISDVDWWGTKPTQYTESFGLYDSVKDRGVEETPGYTRVKGDEAISYLDPEKPVTISMIGCGKESGYTLVSVSSMLKTNLDKSLV